MPHKVTDQLQAEGGASLPHSGNSAKIPGRT